MIFEKVSFDTFCDQVWKQGFHDTANELESFYEDFNLPVRSTINSVGYDFFCPLPVTLTLGEMRIVPTGVKCKFFPVQNDYHLKLYVRSSVGIKRGIILINGTGIIDADYYNNPTNEGCILMPLYNLNGSVESFYPNERIVQGIFEKHFITVDDNVINMGKIRTGGVGSTDK